MHYEQCSLRKIKGACLRPQRTILGNVCWQKGRLRLFGIKTKALMTDLDLLRAELDDFAQPVKKKSLRHVKNGLSLALKIFNNLLKTMAVCLSPLRIEIFLSGCMPHACSGCVCCKSVVNC